MLSAFNSQKIRFWSFISMALLVYVHGYNLNQGYLQPWTIPGERLTFTTFAEYFLSNGIFRFRIPMLFIISGYLFAMGDDKPFKQRAGKRVKTLLYPYLIWSAVGLLLTYVLELFPYSRNIVAATHMMQIDGTRLLLHQYYWYEVIARWIFFPVSYQLWFIRVLLIYNLTYPIVALVCYSSSCLKRYFFLSAILFWLATGGLILLKGRGLLFFSLGIWMQKSSFNIDEPGKWLQPKYWMIVFIGLSAIKTLLAFNANFNGVEIVLLILHKLVVLSGLIFAWYGCNSLVKYCMSKKWIVWLCAFSFMIYVLHAPLVVYATKAIFLQIENWYAYRLLTYIVLPFCLIILAVIFGALLRKFLPKVYSFVTGGRGL